jgi:hypothetical protein
MVQEGFADRMSNRHIIWVTPSVVALFIGTVSMFKCTSRPLAIHIGALCGLIAAWVYFYKQARMHIASFPRGFPVLAQSPSDTPIVTRNIGRRARRDAGCSVPASCIHRGYVRRMISAIVVRLVGRVMESFGVTTHGQRNANLRRLT